MRNSMLTALEHFEVEPKAGMFINSCFAHCQSELQDTWFAPTSPMIHNKVFVIFTTASYTYMSLSG
jgi:O-palmitoleoyl-L-serine hydrolase